MSRKAPAHTPPFTPLRSMRTPIALGRRFYQIGVAVAAEVHAREGSGLRNIEFGILVRLHDEPGLDQNTLAERMALDRTSVSAMVFRLEQEGLITRAVNGADRRGRLLRLTPAGRKLHDRLRPRTQAAQEGILSVLTPAERVSFLEMLERVVAANQAYVRPGAGRRRPGSARTARR